MTARSDLNILSRANRELDADFELNTWRHSASWNEDASRIEMRLICERAQAVRLGKSEFCFHEGVES